mgnify:CR=1 FL=1
MGAFAVIKLLQGVTETGSGARLRTQGGGNGDKRWTGYPYMFKNPIAGKTGTAQNPHGEDHSVFIAFAPKDDPKIAIAVYVENAGWGGRAAASTASLMIEKYLKGQVTRPALEEYVLAGNFIY